MPITTSSDTALEYYLEGRELAEKLRGQESIEFFDKAIAEDPDFAMAYLNLALVSPTTKGFFENFDRARALADEVSEGERLNILGIEAGINAFIMQQRDLYTQLVEAYPRDERAHGLLGNHYFTQQEFEAAIGEYALATEINPGFSPVYNQLGYAHRFLQNYDEAEKAFMKYVELIPDDPNPYDSYAELLMKMGKFDESIEQYRKALEIDPNFVASHLGIATNLNFKNRHADARKQIDELYAIARNDGERRTAHFAMAVSFIDEGMMADAIEEIRKQYALAERIDDAGAMGADLNLIGNILLEWGKYDEALANYEQAAEVVRSSDLSDEVKDNSKRNFLYNSARVDIKLGDLASARAKAGQYREEVEALGNPNQVRLAHQLAGMIALAEEDFDLAARELEQASQLNAYNLYRLSLAYRGRGDIEKSREYCAKAADYNGLVDINYTYIRTKSKDMLNRL
ncbi:MAG: tetratricopeptide repeat protein [bacterium]|jgi:tetratricopeptide (TPR) repeat protein